MLGHIWHWPISARMALERRTHLVFFSNFAQPGRMGLTRAEAVISYLNAPANQTLVFSLIATQYPLAGASGGFFMNVEP